MSWGWLFKGRGMENRTGGIEGLSQCAGATGAVQGTLVEHSGLDLARGACNARALLSPREPLSPQAHKSHVTQFTIETWCARVRPVVSTGGAEIECLRIPEISWASRADFSGSEHPLEQENPSGHSDSDAGASIHTLL